jgi:hypothetical protein
MLCNTVYRGSWLLDISLLLSCLNILFSTLTHYIWLYISVFGCIFLCNSCCIGRCSGWHFLFNYFIYSLLLSFMYKIGIKHRFQLNLTYTLSLVLYLVVRSSMVRKFGFWLCRHHYFKRQYSQILYTICTNRTFICGIHIFCKKIFLS